MAGKGESKAALRRKKSKEKSKKSGSLAPAAPPAPEKMALWDDSDSDGDSKPMPKKKRSKKEPMPPAEDNDFEEVNDDEFNEEEVNDEEVNDEEEVLVYDPPSEGSDGGSDGVSDMDDASVDSSDVPFSELSTEFFSTLIHPTTPADFFDNHFEKKPLHIARGGSSDSPDEAPLLSRTDIETYLEKQSLVYGRDINVTNVVDGVRHTMDLLDSANNHTVVAAANDVWSNVSSGCSVRLLCPHKFSDSLHTVLSTLETTFGCMVGSNAYLTPRSSQGFAPHYDDVDVFILQQEGSKRWRVYEPFTEPEVLPRVSSADYDPANMPKKAYLDVTLAAGDFLYLPRGWIHQAVTTVADSHSLHVTVSVMQSWSWADLVEHVLPEAMKNASNLSSSSDLREGLPLDYLDYMGVMNDNDYLITEEKKSKKDKKVIRDRREFKRELKTKLDRIVKEAMKLADFGCDEMGKRFLSERVPPAFSEEEAALTNDGENGEICAETMVRIARGGIARLVSEEDKCVVYHCADNERDHRSELSPLEFEMDDAPAIELLLKTMAPMWVKVSDLPHPPADDIDDKIEVVKSLYEEGIVAVMQPEWIKDRVGAK